MSDKLGHQPALDGLRGVAILLVLLMHVTFVSEWQLVGGFLGVDLFFVLSGFLITTLILERHGTEGLWPFYRRRILRLFPAAFALVAVHVAAAAALAPERLSEVASSGALALSYGFNWLVAADLPFTDTLKHYWSLAIEEQFYLAWPILLTVALNARWSRRRLITCVVLSAVAVAVWRAVLAAGGDLQPLYYRTDTRVDALLIGAALALWRPVTRHVSDAAVSTSATAALVVFLAAAVVPPQQALYSGGFVVIAMAAGVMVVAALDGRWTLAPLLACRPLRVLGTLSYSLYLWHYPVFLLVGRSAVVPSMVRLPVALLLTGALSVASHRYVEQPFLRWKNRLEETAPRTPAAAAPATT